MKQIFWVFFLAAYFLLAADNSISVENFYLDNPETVTILVLASGLVSGETSSLVLPDFFIAFKPIGQKPTFTF